MRFPSAQALITYCVPFVQSDYAATGWLPSLQLAQILDESAIGTSTLAALGNNLAGVSYTGLVPSSDHGGSAWYPNLDTFWRDYRRVQQLGAYNGIRQAGPHIDAQIAALVASPYASSHYYGGGTLSQLVAQYGLTKYDPADSSPAAATPASKSAPTVPKLSAAVRGSQVVLTAPDGMAVVVDATLVVGALVALVELL